MHLSSLSNSAPRIFCGLPGLWILILGLAGSTVNAQIPSNLTDKIYKGEGVIDLLKDVTGSQLDQYIQSDGRFLLGVDLNENASGNENSDSVGVAIKQIELIITTSQGDFTFQDFYTSTTAMIQEAGGSTAQEFHTVFGHSGSNSINGSTTGFDLSSFDDVIEIRDVSVLGAITGAQLNITFLDTANTGSQGNETFFDYSGGFEDFALLNAADAALLEAANVGVAAAPSGIEYVLDPEPSTIISPTAGAPAPPLLVLVALGLMALFKARRSHA
jgi:hypothetical protein